nr:hypothetical protein [Bacillus paranthracis]
MQVELPMPNRQQVWLPVESRDVQVGANMSLGIRPEHLLPSEVGGQAVLGRQRSYSTPWLTERHGYDPS